MDEMDVEMIKHMRKQVRENERNSTLNKVIPDDRDFKTLPESILKLCKDLSFSETMKAITSSLDLAYLKRYEESLDLDRENQDSIHDMWIRVIEKQLITARLKRKK